MKTSTAHAGPHEDHTNFVISVRARPCARLVGRRLATTLCSLLTALPPVTTYATVFAPGAVHAQEKQLKSWGDNRSGQLGDRTWINFRTTATTVLGLTSAEVVKIVAPVGGDFSLAN